MKHIYKCKIGLWSVFFGLSLLLTAHGQNKASVAFLVPEKSPQSETVEASLENLLSAKSKILDNSQVNAVLNSRAAENLYNLSTEEAQTLGNAIGCNFLIILKTENQRRSSFSKNTYYESYISLYLVSTRTGRLVFWTLKSLEAENPEDADKKLFASLEKLADEISANLATSYKDEINEAVLPNLEELPEENSPAARNFRSPLPFKRLRPAYTPIANLYGIAATVDALVDLDENGQITHIEITRWAGYGLDESVTKTIREMNWRAASRDGKTLPIRVLLRYNFKKLTDNE